MKLFETLARAQRETPFYHSDEYLFFVRNAYRLNESESFAYLSSPQNPFDVVRANIVIRSLINKEAIERFYRSISKLKESGKDEDAKLDEYMKNAMNGLPYLDYGEKKIYVPVFPISLAEIYGQNFEKLSAKPYKRLLNGYQAMLIDCFDYYGYALFSSFFTRLITIKKTQSLLVSYDYDAESLYFINDQGRLESRIAFFDKDLPSPNKNHMVKRIERVATAYLTHDREGLLLALKEEKLISEKLILSLSEKGK